MKNNKKRDDKSSILVPINRSLIKYAAIILIMIAFVYMIVADPQKITSAMSTTVAVLSPFLIGLCLAYVVNLLLRPVERVWCCAFRKSKQTKLVLKSKRPVCLVFSYIVMLGLIFAIVFMIIPALRDALVSFYAKLPQYAKTIEQWYGAMVDFLTSHGIEITKKTITATEISDLLNKAIKSYGGAVLGNAFVWTTSIVTAIVDIILGIAFSIYVLAQKEKLGVQVKKAVNAIFEREKAERFVKLTKLTDDVFAKFVTGQLTESCIIGLLCFIGMLIFRMPHASIVSVIIGVSALVPIFGSFIGTGIGAFLILFENPVKAFWFVVFIIVLQQLEGNLIYPRVVGKSVGLPGIWVLFSVTLGGSLFGVPGMLFSVPICTVIYIVFRDFVNKKNKERITEEVVDE